MARPRIPEAIKDATGNRGRRPRDKGVPIASGTIPDPPDWMTDEQKSIWEYALRRAPMGVLASVDWGVFTVFVVAFAAHEEAAQKCISDGMTMTTTNGNVIQSPWVGIMNRQALIVIRACGEMGFTPASRSKVSTGGGGSVPEQADPASEFFN